MSRIDLVVLTRDAHPADHCSFSAQGGPWPSHCVRGSSGFEFHPAIKLPSNVSPMIVEKATTADKDAYSGFDGTTLTEELQRRQITRVVVAGLATDYCVRATVLDAIKGVSNVGCRWMRSQE